MSVDSTSSEGGVDDERHDLVGMADDRQPQPGDQCCYFGGDQPDSDSSVNRQGANEDAGDHGEGEKRHGGEEEPVEQFEGSATVPDR